MLRDSLIYLMSKALPGLTGLLSVVLFVRLVGVEEYGRYALGFSTVTMLGALSVAWLNQSQLRYYSRYSALPGLYRDALRSALKIAAGFLLLLGALTLLLLPFASVPFDWSTVSLIVLLCLIFIFYLVRMVSFQAQLRPRDIAWMEAARAVLALLLPLGLAALWGNHRALLIGLILAYSCCFLLPGPWHGLPESGKHHLRRARVLVLRFWHYGWPMSLWSAAMFCLPFIDRSLIQYFYGFEQTGSYASLYDLVVRVYALLFFPVTLAAHPRIMKAWNLGNGDEAITLLRRALMFQLILFVPFFLLNLLSASWIVSLILGTSNTNVRQLVLPLACGGALWQMALLAHKPLEMMANTRLMLLFMLLALLVCFFGNLIGLPRFGPIAAAYANVASAVVYLISCGIYALRFRRNVAVNS